jgi:hypothetical protein
MKNEGLNIIKKKKKIYHYVSDYFKGCKLSSFEDWAFESYIFYFEEIIHLIPKKYHQQFKDDDKFTGASGLLEFESMSDEYQNKEYVLMTVTDEHNTKIYFLYVQELDEDTNEQRDILIKDFME